MKTRLIKITRLIMALLLCAPIALAESVGVQIGAQVALEGMMPRIAEEYTIRISADAPDNPMPNGQRGGSFDMAILGADSAAFPSMTFDAVGIYRYTIQQMAGDSADCLYDARVYRLTVSVVHTEAGDLAAFVAMSEGEGAEKAGMARFLNAYQDVMPTSAPTNEPGSITPTGVRDMWLYCLIGAVALLNLAIVLFIVLMRRRRDDRDDED